MTDTPNSESGELEAAEESVEEVVPNDDSKGPSRLAPMTRRMQAFAMSAFFVFGLVTATFLVLNPFGLSFLPSRTVETGRTQPTAVSTEPEQVYQCPMHPEVIDSVQSDCPICGMKLMPVQGATPATEPSSPNGERKILYWYAPMDPSYISDVPGKSPMGMDLVPKYGDGTPETSGAIRIDPVQVQNIGVVSKLARIGDIERTIKTVGILAYNANNITWINTKFSGWIERSHVTYIGQEVKVGEPLFDIYSPELVTTQEEYLRALGYKESLESSNRSEAREQADNLLSATRARLTYWDIAESQIQALEASRKVNRTLTVFAPVSGIVTEVLGESLDGMFIKAGMNLYQLADLSTIWVHAAIYETELPWVRAGQQALVTFRHDPSRSFRGRILFLYPEVNKETRTLKVCIEVPNQGRQLRAGMYADVEISAPPTHNAVLIPKAAVLRTGERNLVFVDLGNGHFEPRTVSLGIESELAEVQVLEGIVAGDAVVTQAQFMLDSESRVQEAVAKFMKRGTVGADPIQAPPPAGHDHGGN